MLALAATTLIAPLLVAATTLVARRHGPNAGGIVSAFPAIVGPVLLIDLLEHDARFTADAASGTLLGLVALALFAALYGRIAAARRPWPRALLAAWAGAGIVGALLAALTVPPLLAALAAAVALVAAARALPPTPPHDPAAATGQGSLPVRMLTAAALVVALSAAAGALGPTAGGVLSALPVLASVLAVFTHRDHGPHATVALLLGMLRGLAGYVAFCLLIALLIEPAGPAAAFSAATAAALAAQLATAARTTTRAHNERRPLARASEQGV